MTHLEKIYSPEELKLLSIPDLKVLSQEIRDRIIRVLSVNGGHLASNLGSIELTLALHYVFRSPADKLIFDVSHQTYTHKLITGRNDARFDRIRQYKGLNGFSHPKESPHDHFYAGHAGTALSLALGMARARDLAQEKNHVIPIIGDATLTCGLSLEALNNISRDLSRFILVLNDNEMSISKNVGGITNILSRLLNNPTTSKWRRELETLVSKIPHYGSSLAKQGFKLTESVKNIVSSAPFFEQFGFSYIGPIDGHDVKKLIAVFEAVKDLDMPIVIHAMTKKGQGVERAERDPITYHGVKPFDPKTCEFLPSPSKKATFPKIFGKHMVSMGEKNPRLAVITPAMSLGSCLTSFDEKFPSRFFDVGIAEGHAVTFSGGLAKTGKLNVVCSIYATFLQRALDNLFQDVCLQEIPVVFAIDRGGLSPGDGATHHGIYEIGFLRTMPNMAICQPRDGHLLKELLESAFSWKCPAAIRYPNLPTDEREDEIRYRPLGKGEILAEGEDLLIIALGHKCTAALELRAHLKEEGVSAAVVDPIFVKPLDKDLFSRLLLKHNRIVTIEEHSLKGGLGSEINEFLVSHDFGHVEVLNFGIPETFLDQGGYQDLLDEIGLTPEKMLKKIMAHFSFYNYAEK
ncbi:MAG: 1-deoxy-D-xylulose-5-phosphate synthase [Chlamydiales bacterium]|nr:1-deoxy-D-xylulose-5-phosphate synthase [Chlamydiales bacterium]